MRVDVSEIKTYRECHRKHEYSSRNRFHLHPIVPNDNLIFGTQFHEVLAMMYLGTSIDKILEWIDKEVTNPTHFRIMSTMAEGYYNGPYKEDKERYEVVDIEKSFNYPIGIKDPNELGVDEAYFGIKYSKDENGDWIAVDADGQMYETVCVCGSIDMVVIDKRTNKLCGFEHKTAKNFRPEVYNLIDEQPRVYSWALKRILQDYHSQGLYTDIHDTGPIFLNQVKKLQNKFAYERSVCTYSAEDLANFMELFTRDAQHIANHTDDPTDALPQPGYMKCQMCDYADICMHYGYANINKEELIKEFSGEFEVRDHDHLDEKAERHVLQ